MTPEDQVSPPNTGDSLPTLPAARRRLLRGGLATAPALLTLVNLPVMAATCRTPSAALSASLSRPNAGVFECTGKSPASWDATAEAGWPTGTRAMLFSTAIGPSADYGTKTLLEMVGPGSDTGTLGLARHLVAAYLNAKAGLTPVGVLSEPVIKAIWARFPVPGWYEPTAGIKWFPDYAEPSNPLGGLTAWLKTTMPN
jgi:hypothetical protein